jgi:hypothetical protein
MNDQEVCERFVDTGTKVYDLGDEFLVVCPKCSGRGLVTYLDELPTRASERFFAPRRFVCHECMHRAKWRAKQISVGGPLDWYFGFPLWLQIPCCGEILWANNIEHIEILRSYVNATLRERTKKGRNSFLSKLPKWIGAAKNRKEIVKALDRLRAKADEQT